MKTYFAILLTMILLLTGCASASQTAPTSTEVTAPTEAAEPQLFLASVTIEGIMGDINSSSGMEYIRDEQGFVQEVIFYTNGEEISRSTMECDDKGNPLVETTVSGDVTTVTESQLTYDDAGMLTSKIDTVTVDGAVTDVREYHYYDAAAGKHSLVKFFRGGETEPYSAITYEYNDQGLEVLEIAENSGSISRTETTYNDQAQAIKKITTDEAGNILNMTDYTYEADSKVTQTSSSADGTVLYTIVQLERQEGDTKITETYMNDTLSSRVTSVYKTLEG